MHNNAEPSLSPHTPFLCAGTPLANRELLFAQLALQGSSAARLQRQTHTATLNMASTDEEVQDAAAAVQSAPQSNLPLSQLTFKVRCLDRGEAGGGGCCGVVGMWGRWCLQTHTATLNMASTDEEGQEAVLPSVESNLPLSQLTFKVCCLVGTVCVCGGGGGGGGGGGVEYRARGGRGVLDTHCHTQHGIHRAKR